MFAYYCLGTTKITQKRMQRLTTYIKPHATTVLSVPTKWCRNALTTHLVEIVMSLHPMYSRQE